MMHEYKLTKNDHYWKVNCYKNLMPYKNKVLVYWSCMGRELQQILKIPKRFVLQNVSHPNHKILKILWQFLTTEYLKTSFKSDCVQSCFNKPLLKSSPTWNPPSITLTHKTLIQTKYSITSLTSCIKDSAWLKIGGS